MMRYMNSGFFYGLLLVCLAGISVSGCGPKKMPVNAATGLSSYLADANAQAAAQQAGEGSLWVGQGAGSNLFRDFKARRINDMVTIVVSESTQASSAADTSSSKDSSAKIGAANLFGLEKKVKELSSAVDASSNTTFKGAGSTSRATTLSTTVTARVKGVLPNGYLLIEGVRELRLNNENQTVYLTGIVRPEDISAKNLIPSGSIAQLEVRVQGRGVVSQPQRPGLLFRILNGVFPF
jgi:flagellar L-ring protein precursor FlgH